MLRPRSIKEKLKWWVVIIFVLTGAAGWAGIWGLLYLSRTTRAVTSDEVHDSLGLLLTALFITVLVCQVFSAWAGWKLSSSLTAELQSLKESAERISMGDLKNEVKVATTDREIVEVGEALDRLRVSLGKAMDRLAQMRAPRHVEPAGEPAPREA